MISPSLPYDDTGVMTGSVTTVDGVPTALYSSHGHQCPGKGHRCPVIASARASNLTDPLLVRWEKTGVAMLNQAPGFRDPSSAFRSGGKWRVLTACQNCNGTASMLGLFSSEDFKSWEFTSTPLLAPQLECPDYWPVVVGVHVNDGDGDGNGDGDGDETAAIATAGLLSAIKLSQGGKEVVWVGTWDESTQTLTNILYPRLPAQRQASLRSKPEGGVLLDQFSYASKSFYDPLHRQQVWTSWIHELYLDRHGGCVNETVCSTHTLPRALAFDPELQAHVTPPVPQTALLRRKLLHSLHGTPTELGDDVMRIPEAPASGLQLEILATFALPSESESLVVGINAREGTAQRTSAFITVDSGIATASESPLPALRSASLEVHVNNTNQIIPGRARQLSRHQVPFAIKESDSNVTLRVFVDHSVVEAYSTEGRGVVTSRTYPTDDALGASLFCAVNTDCELPGGKKGKCLNDPSASGGFRCKTESDCPGSQ
eukprot:g6447.t1